MSGARLLRLLSGDVVVAARGAASARSAATAGKPLLIVASTPGSEITTFRGFQAVMRVRHGISRVFCADGGAFNQTLEDVCKHYFSGPEMKDTARSRGALTELMAIPRVTVSDPDVKGVIQEIARSGRSSGIPVLVVGTDKLKEVMPEVREFKMQDYTVLMMDPEQMTKAQMDQVIEQVAGEKIPFNHGRAGIRLGVKWAAAATHENLPDDQFERLGKRISQAFVENLSRQYAEDPLAQPNHVIHQLDRNHPLVQHIARENARAFEATLQEIVRKEDVSPDIQQKVADVVRTEVLEAIARGAIDLHQRGGPGE